MLETDRLLLRQWLDKDKDPFYELNSNAEVMKFFPNILSRKQSDAFANKIIKHIEDNHWGLFAVEEKADHNFIGFIGLASPNFRAHFTPCIEIGWRLHHKYWKKGYATEGANAVLQYAFEKLNLKEVVSFTSAVNLPSIKLMERINMKRDLSGDFNHPNIQEGHHLQQHVLYRIRQQN